MIRVSEWLWVNPAHVMAVRKSHERKVEFGWVCLTNGEEWPITIEGAVDALITATNTRLMGDMRGVS
jgi:hypothetical protein